MCLPCLHIFFRFNSLTLNSWKRKHQSAIDLETLPQKVKLLMQAPPTYLHTMPAPDERISTLRPTKGVKKKSNGLPVT